MDPFCMLSVFFTLVTASGNATLDSDSARLDLDFDIGGHIERISTWVVSGISSMRGGLKSLFGMDQNGSAIPVSFPITNGSVVSEDVPSFVDVKAQDPEADDQSSIPAEVNEDTQIPNVKDSLAVCPVKTTIHDNQPIAVYNLPQFELNKDFTIDLKQLYMLLGAVLVLSTLGLILYFFIKMQSMTLTLDLERKAHELEIKLRDQQAANDKMEAENALLKEKLKLEREKTKLAIMKEKQVCKVAQEKHRKMSRTLAEKINMTIVYCKQIQDLKAELEVAQMGPYGDDNGWPC